MLRQRIAELIPVLNGGGDLAATFDPTFLAAVPAAQFRAITAQLGSSLGQALSVGPTEPVDANQAVVTVRYEHGAARVGVAVSPTTPGRVIGLRVLSAGPEEATLGAVIEAIHALPGQTNFALADLGDGAPRVALGLQPDQPLALGSAFKLVVLATLVQDIEAGRRHWDDAVTLDGTERPAGGYNHSPAGTRVPLRELARQMISISDNSATDILIDTLGRERIEAMQATVGWAHPERNRPWLMTIELFKLKGSGGGTLGVRYLAADVAGRRALLAGEVAHMPGSAIGPLFADGRPVRIGELEWFASAADLVRVMDWLRRHSESGPGAEARTILAINPLIPPQIAGRYAYVGFKGGSEPGVIDLTLLLRTRGGQWRVLTAGWNNPVAAVDQTRLILLVSHAAELAAQ